jgi:hypothetical protein
MRVRTLMAIQLGATAIPPRTELEITDENERALKVYYDRGSVELVPHDRDPGDEQPPGPQPTMPSEDGSAADAGAAGDESAAPVHPSLVDPVLGIAQPESAPQQGPEPATDVSPAKADKPRARKGAK